jgi:hypothetical protein
MITPVVSCLVLTCPCIHFLSLMHICSGSQSHGRRSASLRLGRTRPYSRSWLYCQPIPPLFITSSIYNLEYPPPCPPTAKPTHYLDFCPPTNAHIHHLSSGHPSPSLPLKHQNDQTLPVMRTQDRHTPNSNSQDRTTDERPQRRSQVRTPEAGQCIPPQTRLQHSALNVPHIDNQS